MTDPNVADESLRGAGEGSDLTRIQQLLWAGQQLHPAVPLYNMALAYELTGPLDVARFERAVCGVIARADALRTVFSSDDGAPSRRVAAPGTWTLPRVDFSSREDGPTRARIWMADRVRRVFDPAEPLFDTALLAVGPGRHIWYINQHHLITDGWSTALLYREVAEAYEALRSGGASSTDPLPAYDEHLEQERALLGSRAHDKAVEHWRAQLEDVVPMALYGKREERRSTASERRTVSLGAERSEALRTLAERPEARGLTSHLSLFNVFAASLFAFIHRVSGERRVAVAAPSHNRRTETDKSTLGVFMEVFPLVVEIDEEDSFADLLQRTARASAGFVRYALPGASQPHVNDSCNVVLNYIQASFPPFGNLRMRSEWLHPGHADLAHDLRVQVHDFDEAGTFVLHFDLSTERFDEGERKALVRHFLTLLDAFVADPERPIDAPSLADPNERSRRLANEVRPEPAPEGTVLQRIAAHVERMPDRPALICGEETWSYRDLDAAAQRVADRLATRGVAGGTVALMATRRPETVAALLGVLRAGAAYIPLDPAHPVDRLRLLIEESRPSVLLVDDEEASRFADLGLERLSPASLARGPSRPPPAHAVEAGSPAPDDLVYVLYTSGSTGRPKGVMVTHRSLLAYADWAVRTYWCGEPLSAPFFTPLTFDLTVTSIFGPLLAGGSIVVYPLEEAAVDTALLRVLEEDRVEVVKLTPAHLALLRGRDLSGSRIRRLIVGGANLRSDVARAAWDAFGGRVEIHNEYGPTEATVGCMIHRFDPEATGASVPIGRAAGPARVRLVDDRPRPVPRGIIGQILVGGSVVARGYLDRPEETAARFVEDPAHPGDIAYRTGDIGRELLDGTIEFLGRRDRQIKLHDVRIEPGEIEAALADVPGVEACVVDLVQEAKSSGPDHRCARCGLGSDYPGAAFDDEGVCSVCRTFERYEERTRSYFQSMERLEEIFAGRPGPASSTAS